MYILRAIPELSLISLLTSLVLSRLALRNFALKNCYNEPRDLRLALRLRRNRLSVVF
jgi:hypothetical protein